MALAQVITLLLVTTLLLCDCGFSAPLASPAEDSFRSNFCSLMCTKDPPEGGNFCNCDKHPLGKRSLPEDPERQVMEHKQWRYIKEIEEGIKRMIYKQRSN